MFYRLFSAISGKEDKSFHYTSPENFWNVFQNCLSISKASSDETKGFKEEIRNAQVIWCNLERKSTNYTIIHFVS